MGPLISHSTNTGTNAVDFLFKQGEKTGSGRMRPYNVQLTVGLQGYLFNGKCSRLCMQINHSIAFTVIQGSKCIDTKKNAWQLLLVSWK
jgi:hypothetical protein